MLPVRNVEKAVFFIFWDITMPTISIFKKNKRWRAHLKHLKNNKKKNKKKIWVTKIDQKPTGQKSDISDLHQVHET